MTCYVLVTNSASTYSTIDQEQHYNWNVFNERIKIKKFQMSQIKNYSKFEFDSILFIYKWVKEKYIIVAFYLTNLFYE